MSFHKVPRLLARFVVEVCSHEAKLYGKEAL